MTPDLPKPASPREDEDDLDLPALDGALGDEEEAPPDDLDEREVPREEGDPFDDADAGDGVVPELEIAGDEGGWLADAQDADVDVGGDLLDLREEADLLADNEAPGVGDEDYGLGGDGADSALDAGEEGPDAEDEELREQDLPELDSDDQGEGDDEAFFELDAPREESSRPPSANVAWKRVGAPVHVAPMRSLACAARGVLAGGRGLVRVDLEGGCESLAAEGLTGGDVTAVRFDGAVIVVTTEQGGVFVSRDGGAHFSPANGWRDRVSAPEAAGELDIVLGASELWARTVQGRLLHSPDFGATWELAPTDGFVVALGVDDRGALVAVASALGGAEILRGRGSSLETSRIRTGVVLPPGARAAVAAWGAALALAVEGEGVYLVGEGATLVDGTQGAASLEFLDRDGTLAVGIAGDLETSAALLRVSPSGHAHLVAELDEGPSEACAVAWDQAHGVVWVAGAFGLVAFEPTGPPR